MNEVTLLPLCCAKVAGYTALIITLDTFLLGWRSHNLNTVYLPFAAGVGMQVGMSDLVFMHQQVNSGLMPHIDECSTFLLDLDVFCMHLTAEDVQVCEAFALGSRWLQEANSGVFRT